MQGFFGSCASLYASPRGNDASELDAGHLPQSFSFVSSAILNAIQRVKSEVTPFFAPPLVAVQIPLGAWSSVLTTNPHGELAATA